MNDPTGNILISGPQVLKSLRIFVDFLRLRSNDLDSKEVVAIANTVALLFKIRQTFPLSDDRYSQERTGDNIKVERCISFGELHDALIAYYLFFNNIPRKQFSFIRDMSAIQEQFKKLWIEVEGDHASPLACRRRKFDASVNTVKVLTSLSDLYLMRDLFVMLINDKARQFLSFDAIIQVCQGIRAIQAMEDSFPKLTIVTPGHPHKPIRLPNKFDEPSFLVPLNVELPEELIMPLHETCLMCMGDAETFKKLGCFKQFLDIRSDIDKFVDFEDDLNVDVVVSDFMGKLTPIN